MKKFLNWLFWAAVAVVVLWAVISHQGLRDDVSAIHEDVKALKEMWE